LKTNIVIWLRKTHGWIGLWGATLGLLFGASGIWLNHRAVLQLQPAQERSNWQVALPDPAPADAAAMASWLQSALKLDAPATNLHVEAAKPVAWSDRPAKGDHRGGAVGSFAPAPTVSSAGAAIRASALSPLMQPEHWAINFGGPKAVVQAEYWVGNRSVSVRRTESGFIGTLMNLHKGIGMPVPWILLVDTLAGSMILLSLSGLALWVLTRRKRIVGLAIFGAALAVTTALATAHL
jgi:hypothetical protein